MPDGVGASPCGLTQQGFELGEDLLDGVEVGAVFGEEEELGAGGTNGAAHGLSFVATEIVEDDDVALLEGRYQDLLHVGPKALAVDRPVDDAGRVDAIAAQRGEEGYGSPTSLRHFAQELLAARCPAAQRRHVGLSPGLIDEDEPRGIKPALICLPPLTPSRHVGTILLGGEQCFF